MHSFLVVGTGVITFVICLVLSTAFWSPQDLRTTSPGGRFLTNVVVSGFLAIFAAAALEQNLNPKPAAAYATGNPGAQSVQQTSAPPLPEDRPASSPSAPTSGPESPSQAAVNPAVLQAESPASEPEPPASTSSAAQEPASAATQQSTGSAQ